MPDVQPNGRVPAKPATPVAKREPQPSRFTYALKSYTVEITERGWMIAQNWFSAAGEKPKWIGPFPSIELACLAIARRHATEIADRHSIIVAHHKIKPADKLFGLKGSLSLRAKKGDVA